MRVIFLLLLSSNPLWAKGRQALPFDLSKNGVTVIPSKVRYELKRSGELKIAKIILSQQTFNLSLSDGQLTFTWPNGLFENPRIRLSLGTDSIFESNFSPPEDSAEKPTQSMTVPLPELPESTSTLRFCVTDSVAKPSAKICSELYNVVEGRVERNGKRYITKSQVNGKTVADKGTVSVTPGEKPLILRLSSSTGFFFVTSLKIENRRFVDIQRVKGRKYRIEFLRSSALPEDTPEILIVDVDNPKTQVKEPGQVSMEVGFIVTNIVPAERDKVFFADENVFSTYSSIVRIRLQKNSKRTKLIPVDGTIREIEDKEVEWQIKNMKNDETRKAYLSVERNRRQLMTYAQIKRYRAMEVGMDFGGAPSQASGEAKSGSEMFTQLRFDWWIDDLFRIRVPWFSWQRWGYEFRLQNALSSPEPAKWLMINSTAKYRFKQGIHLVDPTYGAKGVLQLLTESDISASSIGLGLFAELRSPRWMTQLTDWMFKSRQWVLLDFQFFPLTIDQSLKIDKIYSLTARHKYLITQAFDVDLSLNYRVDKYRVGRDKKYDSTMILGMIGFSSHF